MKEDLNSKDFGDIITFIDEIFDKDSIDAHNLSKLSFINKDQLKNYKSNISKK